MFTAIIVVIGAAFFGADLDETLAGQGHYVGEVSGHISDKDTLEVSTSLNEIGSCRDTDSGHDVYNYGEITLEIAESSNSYSFPDVCTNLPVETDLTNTNVLFTDNPELWDTTYDDQGIGFSTYMGSDSGVNIIEHSCMESALPYYYGGLLYWSEWSFNANLKVINCLYGCSNGECLMPSSKK